MPKSQTLSAILCLTLLAALASHAQTPATPPPAGPTIIGTPLSPELARRVEVLVRQKANLPPGSVVHVGPRMPSDVQGYDLVPVTITTEGTPQYVPGQTPEAAARPYVRFTAKPSQPNLQTLGQDSPTQASSEAPDHPARLANDGNDTTCWLAANAATNAWWEVDLERLSDIKRVQLTFPTADNYRYKIETSDDRRQWRPAADETHTTATTRTRPSECVPGSGGRFVRITFTGLPPGALAQISEVKIIGMVRSP